MPGDNDTFSYVRCGWLFILGRVCYSDKGIEKLQQQKGRLAVSDNVAGGHIHATCLL